MKKIVYPVESQLFSRLFINKSCCWESTSACVTTHQVQQAQLCLRPLVSAVSASIPKAKTAFSTLEDSKTGLVTSPYAWSPRDHFPSEPALLHFSCGPERHATADQLLGWAGLRSPSLLLLTSIGLLIRSEMDPAENKGMKAYWMQASA